MELEKDIVTPGRIDVREPKRRKELLSFWRALPRRSGKRNNLVTSYPWRLSRCRTKGPSSRRTIATARKIMGNFWPAKSDLPRPTGEPYLEEVTDETRQANARYCRKRGPPLPPLMWKDRPVLTKRV